METAPGQPRRDSATGPAAVLFLCMFASQAGLLVLGPTLPQVAADLGVSMATAGQLRAISGIAGGVTALALAVFGRRLALRGLLNGGLGLLLAGSLVSAAAPSFTVLAAAQVLVGAAVAVVLAGAVAAAAEWSAAGDRAPPSGR